MAVPDFHTWVGRMVNSIEDTSIISKADPVYNLTHLQKRALVADLVVPVIHSEDAVEDWLNIFRVTLNVGGEMSVGMLISLIGKEETNKYFETDTEEDAISWLRDIKLKIKCGWLPSDR